MLRHWNKAPPRAGEELPTRVDRASNAVDQYSLILQLIQVFPIVAQAAAVAVAPDWLSRSLACAGLLAATGWVVWLEFRRTRNAGQRPYKPRSARRAVDSVLIHQGGLETQFEPVVVAELSEERDRLTLSVQLSLGDTRRQPSPSPCEPTRSNQSGFAA